VSYETLLIETPAPGVQLIRLNRPEALNALNQTLLADLALAFAAADADETVGCLVLTGSEKAFAAGADIKEMADKSYAEMFSSDLFAGAGRSFEQLRKPVIAAVGGFALGGGCELAMLCDFIIAAETAKFGQPEVTLGVMPGIGGSQRLTRLVGKSKAMDMMLTGRLMDATEAERAGLVSRIVPADKLVEEAVAVASRITAQSRNAVMMTKQAVNLAYETTLAAGVLMERRLFHSLFAFEDQKEGMAAFSEKRKPNFTGR
jgi:enoyl-CoA hydratase/carnithine racemase